MNDEAKEWPPTFHEISEKFRGGLKKGELSMIVIAPSRVHKSSVLSYLEVDREWKLRKEKSQV